MTELEHERKGVEAEINRLEYLRFTPVFNSAKASLEAQKLNIEQGKLHEELACFRDIVALKEKLRFSKEELKKQKEKSKLLLNGRNKRTVEKVETGFG